MLEKTLFAKSEGGLGIRNPPMENVGTSNIHRGRTEWTPLMDRYFLDLMSEQVRAGQRSEKSFTKIAWADMKKKYERKALLDQNGFGWDDEKHMVTADSYVWDEYLKEHPKAKPMRTKTMPNFNDLDMICRKSTAAGQYAYSAKDLNSKKLSNVNITQVQDSSDDTAVEDDSPLVNNKVEKAKKKKM
ncbi:hypothetical protein GIB67_000321 [Kingdonia uniflora]|uniref:Myb/SANT-like domain-containing protein n=1 Tax=Kingdonia uniflora TaxID=39325 RepID=A0A7J7LCC6_9MAGN|nr:hypothetical protein GIB67_000321 [Kingdonia uniflora]